MTALGKHIWSKNSCQSKPFYLKDFISCQESWDWGEAVTSFVKILDAHF